MGSGNDSSQPIHAKEFGQGWSQIEADYDGHHNIFMYTYMEVCQKSIVINSNGMNNQLFWGSRGARVLTHNHICMYIYNIYIIHIKVNGFHQKHHNMQDLESLWNLFSNK